MDIDEALERVVSQAESNGDFITIAKYATSVTPDEYRFLIRFYGRFLASQAISLAQKRPRVGRPRGLAVPKRYANRYAQSPSLLNLYCWVHGLPIEAYLEPGRKPNIDKAEAQLVRERLREFQKEKDIHVTTKALRQYLTLQLSEAGYSGHELTRIVNKSYKEYYRVFKLHKIVR